ncbi:hypothetical protein SCOR_03495 [Sulfidibacter corallicola]|uniref:Photosynthesis system II assembly factor Ycf48/Hcf136-like domain-containing protein n=1 Tax=Sulfidibacter corallicola TaxID=2818388 RepID=A0A8A4TFV4_SULCO|nr:hypothetical protein [Sulfidibacter corallicola]QTD48407.1 hypothetical protein J3U87_22740 [Sulfidibacter corallicola]
MAILLPRTEVRPPSGDAHPSNPNSGWSRNAGNIPQPGTGPRLAHRIRYVALLAMLIVAGSNGLFARDTWTTSLLEGDFHGIAHGDPGFVACGNSVNNNGGFWFSADGWHWAGVALSEHTPIAVVWTGQRYVAAGAGGMHTSSDGRSWQPVPESPTTATHLLWDGTRLIAITGTFDHQIFLSDATGQVWQELIDHSVERTTDDLKLVGNGERFLVISRNEVHAYDEANGWTPDIEALREPRTDWLYAVWTGTEFLLRGTDGHAATSADGLTWTTFETNVIQDPVGLAWDGTRYVELNQAGTMVSDDGRDWQRISAPMDEVTGQPHRPNLTLMVAGGRLWLPTAAGHMLTSMDGIRWLQAAPRLRSGRHLSKRLGSRLFFLGNALLNTTDGVRWYKTLPPPALDDYAFFDVAWSGSRYVAVSSYGRAFSSPDGEVWEPHHLGTKRDLISITYAQNRFWILDRLGALHVLDDAMNLTRQETLFSTTLFTSDQRVGLVSHDDRIAAISTSEFRVREEEDVWLAKRRTGPVPVFPVTNERLHLSIEGTDRLMASVDGIHWADSYRPGHLSGDAIRSLDLFGDTFLMLADSGTFISENGRTWTEVPSPELPFQPHALFTTPSATIALDQFGKLATGQWQPEVEVPVSDPAAIVLPWIVNNDQWSSRVTFFNADEFPKELVLRAVDQDGQTRDIELTLPSQAVRAYTGNELFGDMTGYSLFLIGDGTNVTASYITFNREALSGGSSPSQATAVSVESLSSRALFGYLPTDGHAALVLVCPELGATRTPVVLEYFKDGVTIETGEVHLEGNQPTAIPFPTHWIGPSDPEGHWTVMATAQDGAPITGTTFVFNDNRQPSMAAAISLEVQQ